MRLKALSIATPKLSNPLLGGHPLIQPFCGGGEGDTGPVDDVIACFNYLVHIGNNKCTIPGDKEQHQMCAAGNATVNGVDVNNPTTTSSW